MTMLLALVCAIVALALGAIQLQAEGLNSFSTEPPGSAPPSERLVVALPAAADAPRP